MLSPASNRTGVSYRSPVSANRFILWLHNRWMLQMVMCRMPQANSGQFADQVSRPAIHIVLAHLIAHEAHSRSSLLRRHFERAVNRLGKLLGIVWIDRKRILKF